MKNIKYKFRQYFSLFKLKFIYQLQYRLAAYAGIITQFVFGLTFVMLYVAFFDSNSSDLTQLQTIVNYIWLQQAFFALIFPWIRNEDFLEIIKNGNLAYELTRPISFYFKWFFTIIAKNLANASIRCLPIIIIAFLLPKPYALSMPGSTLSLVLSFLSLILSGILVVSYAMIIHLVVFFTIDSKGIMSIASAFADIFSGTTIPLILFPNFLKKIAYMLPFRFMADFPFTIYSAPVITSDIISLFFQSIFWIIIFILIGYLISKKATKKAVVQGG